MSNRFEERDFHKENHITEPNVVTLGEVFLEILNINSPETNESVQRYISAEGAVYPHLMVTPDSIPHRHSFIEKASDTIYDKVPPLFHPQRDRLISSMAWHPLRQKFSVSLRNDQICLYDLNFMSPSPIMLEHEYQKDILCMEWKPCSPNTLAVGCKTGVLIWQILREVVETTVENLTTENKLQDQPPTQILQDRHAYAGFLSYPQLVPVQCISWSPDGRYLACGSINTAFFVIWDLQNNTHNKINLPYTGITVIKWSPNGQYLFTGGLRDPMILWETMTWDCFPWTGFPNNSACISAAWCNDSSLIAMAVSTEPKVYIFSPGGKAGRLVHVEYLGRYEHEGIPFCGLIKEVSWGGINGERLAVSFRNSAFISLLSVFKKSPLMISPLGFIKGPPNGGLPTNILFRPNFTRGALLSVCWENGKISFFPMYYHTRSFRQ